MCSSKKGVKKWKIVAFCDKVKSSDGLLNESMAFVVSAEADELWPGAEIHFASAQRETDVSPACVVHVEGQNTHWGLLPHNNIISHTTMHDLQKHFDSR